ncbi:MAG: hypothetical protein WBO17_14120 [Sphingorhabdus sp.]
MNKKTSLPDSVRALAQAGKWHAPRMEEDELLFSLGSPALDKRLNGGLSRHALHEIFGTGQDDGGTTSAFALLLALRLGPEERRIYWISDERQERASGYIYPLGLADLGADPDNMVIVRTANMLDSLRAAADAIRSRSACAVILETHGKAKIFDLTSSRRLSLAAREAGVLALVIRNDAMPMPSAAVSRWQVQPAPSQPLLANAPGFPAFDVSLLRHRGGIAPFETRLFWDHENRSFHDALLFGSLPSVVASREAEPGSRRIA